MTSPRERQQNANRSFVEPLAHKQQLQSTLFCYYYGELTHILTIYVLLEN